MDNINVYKLEDISEPIKKRLLDWAQKKKSLPLKLMRYTQKRIREFEDVKVSDAKGWQCGLGQMLDLRNEVLYSVLPYALTAYMYHYGRPKNHFVSDYVDEVLSVDKAAVFSSDAYLGIGKMPKSLDHVNARLGIGMLLLRSYVVNSDGAKKPFESLSKCFSVSGVTLQVLPSTQKIFEANYQIVPDEYGGKTFKGRKEQIEKEIERMKCSAVDESPEEDDDADIDDADTIGEFTYEQEAMDIRGEIERLSSDLESLSQIGHPSKEQLKTFAKTENDLDILNAEVDAINKQVEDLGEKCKKLRQGAYSKAKPYNKDSTLGYCPNYETFVKIFVTWYHIWSEAEKDEGTPGWKPAYEIDPIQCTLLFVRSFWDSKLYKEFKECVDKAAEQDVAELRRGMDEYLKEQYTMLREGGSCTFLRCYQPLEAVCFNLR